MSLTEYQKKNLQLAKDLHQNSGKIVISHAQNAGKSVARRAFEEWKKNQVAAEVDELRTEGHHRTRRPLSTAHEAP